MGENRYVLPGRTDNDVKNFWSSRQKRLARILHNSSSNEASSSNSRNKIKSNNAKSARGGFNSSQVSGFGIADEEMMKILPCSSSVYLESSSNQIDETLTIPDLGIKLEHQPFNFCTDLVLPETSLFTDSQIGVEHQQAIVPFSPESRELLARLEDPFFYDILGATGDSCEPFSLPQPFFDPLRRCRQIKRDEPDVFLDDFPADMFDQVDSVRSPVD